MPRILRNYLISFAIIGAILLIVHFIDESIKSEEGAVPPSNTETSVPADASQP